MLLALLCCGLLLVIDYSSSFYRGLYINGVMVVEVALMLQPSLLLLLHAIGVSYGAY